MATKIRFARAASITAFPLAMLHHQRRFSASASASAAASAVTPAPLTSPDITLYQYKICPYCSRPKTLLDYLKVPYSIVEVNPLTKSQIAFSKDYKKVPIAEISGTGIVKESKQILAALQNVLSVDPKKSEIFKSLLTEDTDMWSDWSEKLAIMVS